VITYLNVPFKDSKKAKYLGAKWSISRKTWYVENVENIADFLAWIPDHLKQPCSAKETSIRGKANGKGVEIRAFFESIKGKKKGGAK
jgi:hypothetical protein